MKNWFKDWFDSIYYDELYQERGSNEADFFIDSLISKFNITKNCKILDLACGNGRHAKALVNRGFSVTGLDLSFKKIALARTIEDEQMSFYQHDMRDLFRANYFDYVLNLFTSFGYFDSDRENSKAALNLVINLKKNGILIIDYFNKAWTEKHLVKEEEIVLNHCVYNISRSLQKDRLIKDIYVRSGETCEKFQERVRVYSKMEFVKMFEDLGLKLLDCFGDYNLSQFEDDSSPRMICAFIKL
ncbi:MAG: class I SAM-dependent methyltransferase [Saprospiraceae bacterium]